MADLDLPTRRVRHSQRGGLMIQAAHWWIRVARRCRGAQAGIARRCPAGAAHPIGTALQRWLGQDRASGRHG